MDRIERDASGPLPLGLVLQVHDVPAGDQNGVHPEWKTDPCGRVLRGRVVFRRRRRDAFVGQHVEPGAAHLDRADVEIAGGDEGAIGDSSSLETVEPEAEPVLPDFLGARPLVVGHGGPTLGAGESERGIDEVGLEPGDRELAQRIPPQHQSPGRDPRPVGGDAAASAGIRRGIEGQVGDAGTPPARARRTRRRGRPAAAA